MDICFREVPHNQYPLPKFRGSTPHAIAYRLKFERALYTRVATKQQQSSESKDSTNNVANDYNKYTRQTSINVVAFSWEN